MAYSFHRSLTADHTQVPSDQTNFPVLVTLTDTTFKTVANGGHVRNSSGFDIGFFADAAGTTPLKWDMESYDGTAGVVVAWVKVPTVSSSSNTIFYVLYGDPSITTYQSVKTDVWLSYLAVFHLAESTNPYVDSSGNGGDSTGNSPDGAYPTAITAKIDGGQRFTGGQSISGPLFSTRPGDWTMSGWMKSTSSSNFAVLYDLRGNSSHDGPIIYIDSSTGFATFFLLCVLGNPIATGSTDLRNDGTWHHFAGVWNRSSDATIRLYVDGVQVATSSGSCVGGTLLNGSYFIGDAFAVSTTHNDNDEIRFGGSAFTSDWIKTEYNSQNNPGNIGSPGFLTIGTEIGQAPLITLLAHPVFVQALVTPIGGVYATLRAHPVMAVATGIAATLQAHPVMQANATIPASAVLTAHPVMTPSGVGGQPVQCVVEPKPTGIGTGGTEGGLVF